MRLPQQTKKKKKKEEAYLGSAARAEEGLWRATAARTSFMGEPGRELTPEIASAALAAPPRGALDELFSGE